MMVAGSWMMRASNHEWDWPETQPDRPRFTRSAVTADPQGWASPRVTRFCNRFFTVVVRGIVGIFAAVVAAVGVGAIWLVCAAMGA